MLRCSLCCLLTYLKYAVPAARSRLAWRAPRRLCEDVCPDLNEILYSFSQKWDISFQNFAPFPIAVPPPLASSVPRLRPSLASSFRLPLPASFRRITAPQLSMTYDANIVHIYCANVQQDFNRTQFWRFEGFLNIAQETEIIAEYALAMNAQF